MNGRLIAIGDIHGCRREFEDLLEQLAPTHEDRVVLLGDLVNRGPDSAGVVALAREHATVSLLGNHELRLLHHRETGDHSHLKSADYETLEQLRGRDWDYLEAMPLTYHDEEDDIVFVHGGFLPDEPWREQPAHVVTRIQVIAPDGQPGKRTLLPDAPHWTTRWAGPPFVVYGHTPGPEVVRTRWTLGIDTGCVWGGWLTAFILPEKRIVQVKARAAYWHP